MIYPLTLSLLKSSTRYLPRSILSHIEDESQSFTPEQMGDWGIPSEDIVQITTAYLECIGREHQARLLLAEIIEPCVEIYGKYNSDTSVISNVVDLLREEVLDKEKMAAARDTMIAMDLNYKREHDMIRTAIKAINWIERRYAIIDVSEFVARIKAMDKVSQIKLCVKYFNTIQ